MRTEMPGEEARAEVVTAARAVADDQIYGFATIEVRDRIGMHVTGQRPEHKHCCRQARQHGGPA
jgi:hypothetical protein